MILTFSDPTGRSIHAFRLVQRLVRIRISDWLKAVLFSAFQTRCEPEAGDPNCTPHELLIVAGNLLDRLIVTTALCFAVDGRFASAGRHLFHRRSGFPWWAARNLAAVGPLHSGYAAPLRVLSWPARSRVVPVEPSVPMPGCSGANLPAPLPPHRGPVARPAVAPVDRCHSHFAARLPAPSVPIPSRVVAVTRVEPVFPKERRHCAVGWIASPSLACPAAVEGCFGQRWADDPAFQLWAGTWNQVWVPAVLGAVSAHDPIGLPAYPRWVSGEVFL